MPFPAGAAPPKELKSTQPLLPITIRSSATSSAPPVATLRSLRTNGEEEEVEVFEEAAAEIDGDGDAGELDAVLLLGGGRGGGISAAAEALLAAESRGGSPRSESTSRTWTASPSPSESVMFAFFFLREWKKLCSFPPCSSLSLPSLLSSPLFSKENETVEKSQRQTESNSARLLDPLFPGTARTASASLSLSIDRSRRETVELQKPDFCPPRLSRWPRRRPSAPAPCSTPRASPGSTAMRSRTSSRGQWIGSYSGKR